MATSQEWRSALAAAGWARPGGTGPILPLVIGPDQAALDRQQTLEAAGLLSIAIRPPTVPEGTARLRLVVRRLLPDGTLVVDGRATYETDDGALIYVVYGGRWAIAPDMMQRLNDPERPVDPSEYVLRIHLGFETASADYAWLNRIVAIGRGAHVGDAIDYEVFEIR